MLDALGQLFRRVYNARFASRLRDSERLLAATLNASLDAYITIDQHSYILEWNDEAVRMFGYSRADAIGRNMTELIVPPHLRAAHRAGMQRYLETGTSQMLRRRVEITAMGVSGNEFPVELAISPITLAGEQAFVASIRDITEAKQDEQQRRLLSMELDHRVRNTVAIIQSLASQTLNDPRVPDDVRKAFVGRIATLARAHDVLTNDSWTRANLLVLMRSLVESYSYVPAGTVAARFVVNGPEVNLRPSLGVAFALALHELCTNAIKYGALSVPCGRVEITWSVEDEGNGQQHLRWCWTEHDGPAVAPPTRKGFGHRLITRTLAAEPGSRIDYAFPSTGVRCCVCLPLSSLLPESLNAD